MAGNLVGLVNQWLNKHKFNEDNTSRKGGQGEQGNA